MLLKISFLKDGDYWLNWRKASAYRKKLKLCKINMTPTHRTETSFQEMQKAVEQKKEPLSREAILKLPPAELVEYLTTISEAGLLDSFLESLLEDEAMVAQLSYWEKWLTQDQRQLVESIIEAKKEAYPGKSESLPLNLEKKFTDEELRLIFSNIVTIQLTFGCSKGCPFCGVDAVKGVREHIPYAQLANRRQDV